MTYLARKMELWRKFSKTFKKTRSSFSRSFSSGVFWQAQHRTFSGPARSDFVGFVFSSMSVSSDAGIRIGIFKSVEENMRDLTLPITMASLLFWQAKALPGDCPLLTVH